MNNDLTEKQQNVLEFIVSNINDTSIPPTLREIRDHFGFSSLASPRHHLRELSKKGYINLKRSVSRGIELLVSPYAIPVLGEISAGRPVEAFENIEGYLDLVNAFAGKRPLFCLRIKGDSMEGAGIMEGDLVIVRKQETAESGQIVAALLDDEALVKRLYKKNGRLFLKAENPDYPELELNGGRILGKVVGVVRNYEQIPLY
ncbi:MAG: transcriptional repressor LexA [Elusimicrobiota bacterium]